MVLTACDETLKLYAWDNEWCAASFASAERRSALAYAVRVHFSWTCTRAEHHSLSSPMSSRAASGARAAGVWALELRAYARRKAHNTAQALRPAQKRDSSACQPCPLVNAGQNRSGGQLGTVTPRRDRGHLGARGEGCWFCPGALGVGCWSAPSSAPAKPVNWCGSVRTAHHKELQVNLAVWKCEVQKNMCIGTCVTFESELRSSGKGFDSLCDVH